jgi:hypothetical protein
VAQRPGWLHGGILQRSQPLRRSSPNLSPDEM